MDRTITSSITPSQIMTESLSNIIIMLFWSQSEQENHLVQRGSIIDQSHVSSSTRNTRKKDVWFP